MAIPLPFLATERTNEGHELDGLPVINQGFTRESVIQDLQIEHLIILMIEGQGNHATALRDRFSRLFKYLIFVPGEVAHFGILVPSVSLVFLLFLSFFCRGLR